MSDNEQFAIPNNPIVESCVKLGSQYYNNAQYDLASDMFEKAIDSSPDMDVPYLYLMLAESRYREGKIVKAVQAAERLTELSPGFVYGYKLLAYALYDRGWYKKSLQALEKAHSLGENSIDFQSIYALNLAENGRVDEAETICWDLLAQNEWVEETFSYGVEALSVLAEYVVLKPTSLDRFLQVYETFIQDNSSLLDEDTGLASVSMLTSGQRPYIFSYRGYCSKIDSLLSRIDSIKPEWSSRIEGLRRDLVKAGLNHNEFQQEWAYFPCVSKGTYKGPIEQYRLELLYAKLEAAENREAMIRELPEIKEEFPFLYLSNKDFLDKLEAGKVNVDVLRREFDKLTREEEPPTPKKEIMTRDLPNDVFLEEALKKAILTPYVRDNQKPGRNDPCPCGSGKKFKKCCMGNGKYD